MTRYIDVMSMCDRCYVDVRPMSCRCSGRDVVQFKDAPRRSSARRASTRPKPVLIDLNNTFPHANRGAQRVCLMNLCPSLMTAQGPLPPLDPARRRQHVGQGAVRLTGVTTPCEKMETSTPASTERTPRTRTRSLLKSLWDSFGSPPVQAVKEPIIAEAKIPAPTPLPPVPKHKPPKTPPKAVVPKPRPVKLTSAPPVEQTDDAYDSSKWEAFVGKLPEFGPDHDYFSPSKRRIVESSPTDKLGAARRAYYKRLREVAQQRDSSDTT